MLVDTHCHIYPSEMENAEEIINLCLDKNIKLILNGLDKKSNLEVLELSKKYKNVYAAIGYDRSFADDITKEDLILLENQIIENKVVAIGEIGIDYHYGKENKLKQQKVFEEQIKLAVKYDLPIIVHSRDAIQDTYDILKKYNVKGSMHCYTGSLEMAREFIKLGFYIGIDGPITFKNNKKQIELVKELDLNNILIETDSPYLSPEPNRGKQNNSTNLVYIVDKISEVKNIDKNKIEEILYNNSNKLFDLED